jgi:hypothetical protein
MYRTDDAPPISRPISRILWLESGAQGSGSGERGMEAVSARFHSMGNIQIPHVNTEKQTPSNILTVTANQGNINF